MAGAEAGYDRLDARTCSWTDLGHRFRADDAAVAGSRRSLGRSGGRPSGCPRATHDAAVAGHEHPPLLAAAGLVEDIAGSPRRAGADAMATIPALARAGGAT